MQALTNLLRVYSILVEMSLIWAQRMQEVMLEHGMRIACVASFNPSSFHTLTTSNMETRQHMGQMPVEKWRSVAVSPLPFV